jgi:uncharacterized membrane protein
MEGHYRILYAGDLMPGQALQQVIPRLAAKFKLSDEQARDLILGGAGKVLKHGLTADSARRYRDALNSVGLRVSIEPELPTTTDEDPPAPVPEPIAGQGAGDTSRRCPKCGADEVSELTGVCQACGILVERYLANRGMGPGSGPAPADNIHAPPKADLRLPRQDGQDDRPNDPASLPAGQGWAWIAEAWQLFKKQPGAWIGALILFYLILIVVSLLPLIGGLAVTILTPMLSAGLVIGAHQQDKVGRFEISHLFAGVSRYPGPLALVGLVYLLFAIGIGILAALMFVGVLASVSTTVSLETMDPNDIGLFLSTPLLILPVLVAMLLGIPLAMAMYFAPSLVALDQVPVLKAFSLSFFGCLRNILPFLVYGLVAMLMLILGTLPLLLGLLVVLPILTIAVYTAYRDIFYG